MHLGKMKVTPNWQHHSKKYQKRSLKPQALRQSRERLRSLIIKLNESQSISQSGQGRKRT